MTQEASIFGMPLSGAKENSWIWALSNLMKIQFLMLLIV
jgi:hypothetical protein